MNDTSPEVRRLQFEIMMRLGVNRRVELAAEMFMAARNNILTSLPGGLSPQEVARIVYRKIYRDDLPEDFFKDEYENT